jgi:hypothetical protein
LSRTERSPEVTRTRTPTQDVITATSKSAVVAALEGEHAPCVLRIVVEQCSWAMTVAWLSTGPAG